MDISEDELRQLYPRMGRLDKYLKDRPGDGLAIWASLSVSHRALVAVMTGLDEEKLENEGSRKEFIETLKGLILGRESGEESTVIHKIVWLVSQAAIKSDDGKEWAEVFGLGIEAAGVDYKEKAE